MFLLLILYTVLQWSWHLEHLCDSFSKIDTQKWSLQAPSLYPILLFLFKEVILIHNSPGVYTQSCFPTPLSANRININCCFILYLSKCWCGWAFLCLVLSYLLPLFSCYVVNFILPIFKNILYILDSTLCYVGCKCLFQSGYPINKKKQL